MSGREGDLDESGAQTWLPEGRAGDARSTSAGEAAGLVNSPCLSSLNSKHLKGFWIRHGEEELPKQTEDALWTVLTKPYWLAPILSLSSKGLLPREKFTELLRSHFNTKESPLLVAQVCPSIQGYHEILRGFIVPPQWPN